MMHVEDESEMMRGLVFIGLEAIVWALPFALILFSL
jgi:hypothetical protein